MIPCAGDYDGLSGYCLNTVPGTSSSLSSLASFFLLFGRARGTCIKAWGHSGVTHRFQFTPMALLGALVSSCHTQRARQRAAQPYPLRANSGMAWRSQALPAMSVRAQLVQCACVVS